MCRICKILQDFATSCNSCNIIRLCFNVYICYTSMLYIYVTTSGFQIGILLPIITNRGKTCEENRGCSGTTGDLSGDRQSEWAEKLTWKERPQNYDFVSLSQSWRDLVESDLVKSKLTIVNLNINRCIYIYGNRSKGPCKEFQLRRPLVTLAEVVFRVRESYRQRVYRSLQIYSYIHSYPQLYVDLQLCYIYICIHISNSTVVLRTWSTCVRVRLWK